MNLLEKLQRHEGIVWSTLRSQRREQNLGKQVTDSRNQKHQIVITNPSPQTAPQPVASQQHVHRYVSRSHLELTGGSRALHPSRNTDEFFETKVRVMIDLSVAPDAQAGMDNDKCEVEGKLSSSSALFRSKRIH
jgi:hypothetical protein